MSRKQTIGTQANFEWTLEAGEFSPAPVRYMRTKYFAIYIQSHWKV